jgi:hypothetical protein
MESKSSRDFMTGNEFFFDSGRLSIAPAGSRIGEGFRDICAFAGCIPPSGKITTNSKNNVT